MSTPSWKIYSFYRIDPPPKVVLREVVQKSAFEPPPSFHLHLFPFLLKKTVHLTPNTCFLVKKGFMAGQTPPLIQDALDLFPFFGLGLEPIGREWV